MKKKLYPMVIMLITMNFPGFLVEGQDLPKPEELIITEFMANPAAVSDTKGEWIELLNTSPNTLLLNGLTLKDEGSNKFTITDDNAILLSPGQYFLLAKNSDPLVNGGIYPDYKYSNFTLGNSEDEIILSLENGEIIDQIKYNSEWDIPSGSSLELKPQYLNSGFNNEYHKWDLATVSYGDGDYGSPGYENSSTTSSKAPARLEEIVVFPNPCYGNLTMRIKINREVKIMISLINMIGQELEVIDCGTCNEVEVPFNTELLEKGVWMVRFSYGHQYEVHKVLIY